MLNHFADGFRHIAELRRRCVRRNFNIFSVAQRLFNDRPFAGLKTKGHAHDFERQEQVSEDDGRVHVKNFAAVMVTSAAISGVLHISRMEWCLRRRDIPPYSGQPGASARWELHPPVRSGRPERIWNWVRTFCSQCTHGNQSGQSAKAFRLKAMHCAH